MAKKSRRARRAAQRRIYPAQKAPSALPETTPVAVAPSARTTRAAPSPARPSLDLREEYRYVYSDLKRIGLLAAGMFVLLIVLSFIIR